MTKKIPQNNETRGTAFTSAKSINVPSEELNAFIQRSFKKLD